MVECFEGLPIGGGLLLALFIVGEEIAVRSHHHHTRMYDCSERHVGSANGEERHLCSMLAETLDQLSLSQLPFSPNSQVHEGQDRTLILRSRAHAEQRRDP